MSEMVERVRKAIEAHCYEVGFQLKPGSVWACHPMANKSARGCYERQFQTCH